MTRAWSETVGGGGGSSGMSKCFKAIKRQFMEMNFPKNEN